MKTKAQNAPDELSYQPILAVRDIAGITRESESFVRDEMHKGALETVGAMRTTPDRIGDWLDNLRIERQHNQEYFNAQREQGCT